MIDYTVQTVKTDNFEMDYLKFGTGARMLVLLPGMSLKSTMGLASMVVDSNKIFADDFTVKRISVNRIRWNRWRLILPKRWMRWALNAPASLEFRRAA